jgi:hypothetical protein
MRRLGAPMDQFETRGYVPLTRVADGQIGDGLPLRSSRSVVDGRRVIRQ